MGKQVDLTATAGSNCDRNRGAGARATSGWLAAELCPLRGFGRGDHGDPGASFLVSQRDEAVATAAGRNATQRPPRRAAATWLSRSFQNRRNPFSRLPARICEVSETNRQVAGDRRRLSHAPAGCWSYEPWASAGTPPNAPRPSMPRPQGTAACPSCWSRAMPTGPA
jgi:hypothetical protein